MDSFQKLKDNSCAENTGLTECCIIKNAIGLTLNFLGVLGGFSGGPGAGGTPFNGLYGVAPPDRVFFFTLEIYERVGISRNEVYERVGKSFV